MPLSKIQIPLLLVISSTLLNACSVNKLEARLEADPQCKPVINAKTGTLMPCPGTDKEFYRSVGLMAHAPVPQVNTAAGIVASPQNTGANAQKTIGSPSVAPVECKPQLHQKSGSLMPCPAP